MRRSAMYGCAAGCLIFLSASCASANRAPGRSEVAKGIADRTTLSATDLPAPKEWTLPAGVSMDDGLEIDEAAAIALWNNPDFQVALTSLGVARADVIDAGLLKNPVLSLLFPLGPKQLEFTVAWAIDAIWQRPRRVQQATLNAESIANQLIANGLRVVADTKLVFLEALTAERRLALATEQSTVATEADRLAQGRLRAGDISAFEANLAHSDVLRIETLRLTATGARDRAVARLRQMLGAIADGSFKLIEPVAITAGPCAPAADLVKSALAARPDVRAAELQIEAAGARVGLEKARVFAFTATLDANQRGSQGFEMGPGLTAELPIFSRNDGGRARAAAELEQASRRYLAVRANVVAEIATALASVKEAMDTADLLGADASATLTNARRQAESLYSAGEISLLNLLETRRRLLDVEAARVESTYGVRQAIVRLDLATGKAGPTANGCGVR